MDNNSPVGRRLRFSQRHGLTPHRESYQGRDLDELTRTRLWSTLAEAIPFASHEMNPGRTWMVRLYRRVWCDYLARPLDEIPVEDTVRDHLKKEFLGAPWYHSLDLLEFIILEDLVGYGASGLKARIDTVLREELAGFRLLDGHFVEITAEAELEAVEAALKATSTDRYAPARTHLVTAFRKLSARPEPDFRNSIKESISAVEAVSRILLGNRKATLGDALAEFPLGRRHESQ